ncbi:hypothetical protein EYF80_046542 [Liparis tanakae]|uniref:Uncharacterized protein n=1 Tax=Liparis tanakae TaxID=230148 RepID=A0A4Z2FQJ4_9TELE|nr:hypothetical protein EYF80_046542 [Liparis tanakae]
MAVTPGTHDSASERIFSIWLWSCDSWWLLCSCSRQWSSSSELNQQPLGTWRCSWISASSSSSSRRLFCRSNSATLPSSKAAAAVTARALARKLLFTRKL